MEVERKRLIRGESSRKVPPSSSLFSVAAGCSSTSPEPEPRARFPKRSKTSCQSQSMCPKNPVRKDAVGPAATTFKPISAGGNFDAQCDRPTQ